MNTSRIKLRNENEYCCPHCGSDLHQHRVINDNATIGLGTLYVIDCDSGEPIEFTTISRHCIQCTCGYGLFNYEMFSVEDDDNMRKLQEARFAINKAAAIMEGLNCPEYEWVVEAQRLLSDVVLETREFTLPRQ